jgi:hypothetical protein
LISFSTRIFYSCTYYCFVFLFFRSKFVIIKNGYTNLLEWIDKTLDHEFQGIVAGNSYEINRKMYDYNQGVTSLKMMKQRTGTIPGSFLINREHFLIKPYNEMIHRLVDAGIPEFLNNLRERKGEKIADFGPQVLNFEHLGVCFLVCLAPLVLAAIAF